MINKYGADILIKLTYRYLKSHSIMQGTKKLNIIIIANIIGNNRNK